jgi:hypothetical protein
MRATPRVQRARLAYSLELSVPSVGFGLDVSAADEPSGAELCSFAPVDWSALPEDGSIAPLSILLALAAPEEGGAELCSAAPPDVSALPDDG